MGLVLSLQYITLNAGAAAPLAFAVAFCVVLTLGISLTQLARNHPSAGGYYTYISRTLNPRAGFLTAWIYFLYDPVSTAINLAFMGYFVQNACRTRIGVIFPWWIFFLPAVAVVTAMVYRGIEISAKAMAWLTAVEVAILVTLSTYGALHPGAARANAGERSQEEQRFPEVGSILQLSSRYSASRALSRWRPWPKRPRIRDGTCHAVLSIQSS